MTDEVDLIRQRHPLLISLVEHKAHHLRQFQDRAFRLLRIDIHKGVDVVERIHEEVRIDLVTQVLQLLLQILVLQFGQALPVFKSTIKTFDAEVGAKHQDEHDDSQDILFPHDGRRGVFRPMITWGWHAVEIFRGIA